MRADLEWLIQGSNNSFCSLRSPFLPLDIVQYQDELVASLTAQCIALAQMASEALDHGNQQLVAYLVTKRIVDPLEVIKIEKHEGNASP